LVFFFGKDGIIFFFFSGFGLTIFLWVITFFLDFLIFGGGLM